VLLSGVAIAILVSSWREPVVMNIRASATYQAISLGMSAEEVETAFGSPPGDYNRGPFSLPPCSTGAPCEKDAFAPAVRFEEWVYDDGRVTVGFDSDDKVRSKSFLPNVSTPESPTQMLRRWVQSLF
jgi:hypothetical protein